MLGHSPPNMRPADEPLLRRFARDEPASEGLGRTDEKSHPLPVAQDQVQPLIVPSAADNHFDDKYRQNEPPQRMKILHVCESIIGGTGSYLAELIPHQVMKYGAANVVLLIPETQLHFLEPGILEAAPQIVTFARPRRLWGSMFLAGVYLKTLNAFKPDIIHAHSSIAGGVIRLLRASGQAQIVFCPHGWSVDMTGAQRIRKLAEVAERMLARFPDQIIVISHHEYNRAIELGIRADKLNLIPNGISRQVPEVPAVTWEDSRIKVLYAGRFDYQKGVDILLKAVTGLEDRISVRLVGDVAVDQSVLMDPLPSCVTKLGWLDRDGVAAQMKACDVLVVPSRWEGFGLVVVEAMRLSKPVVATAVGGLREILGDGEFGYLVPPEDPEALHQFLKTLDRDKLREMGAIGHQRFLADYTSDRMVRDIDTVYGAQLARRGRQLD